VTAFSVAKRKSIYILLYDVKIFGFATGMSNRGSPEGHKGHIYVVMRATHDMWPAGRMFDMPDIQYVFQQISVLNILNMLHNLRFFSLQNAVYFIMLPFFGACIIHILHTGCAKI
jgi:hypothetical protein